MTDDERFIEWWCSPNASSARLTPQDEPGACAGFAAGLAAGRAEVQKRIKESPVAYIDEEGDIIPLDSVAFLRTPWCRNVLLVPDPEVGSE